MNVKLISGLAVIVALLAGLLVIQLLQKPTIQLEKVESVPMTVNSTSNPSSAKSQNLSSDGSVEAVVKIKDPNEGLNNIQATVKIKSE